MPETKTKLTVATGASESVKTKTENDARVIDHVSQAIDAAQEDLASIGESLSAGARDLRQDVEKMLRDAQRDLKKMSKALHDDLEQLQKDLTKTPGETDRAGSTGNGQSTPR
jgi:ABC-type transporter Mla subunit MlaD